MRRNETTTPCCAARPVCGSGTERGAHGRTETKRARRLRPAVRRLWCAALLLVAVAASSCSGAVERVRRNIRFEGVESVALHGLSGVDLTLRAVNDTGRTLRRCLASARLVDEVVLPRRSEASLGTRWRLQASDPLTLLLVGRRLQSGQTAEATVTWHARGRYGLASANLSQERVPLSDFLRNFGLSVDDLKKLF